MTTYKIYRDGVLVNTSSTPVYTDTGLNNGQGYSYEISAVNSVGEGPKSTPVIATPVAPPPGGNSITVSSIAALKTALANNAYGEIVVTDGTYVCAPAFTKASTSLYIGSLASGASYPYDTRTNPVTVRAQSTGGVTFSGGGASGKALLMFMDGVHDQTWTGFNLGNFTTLDTGNIVWGGDPTFRPAYNITMNDISLLSTLRRPTLSNINSHGFYFADALTTGPHHITLNNCSVDGTDTLGLWSALHGFHGAAGHPPASNITVNNFIVNGTLFPIVMWYDTGVQHDWLIDGATITNAQSYAIRFESINAVNIVLKDITSTGSGLGGFYSSMGANPPGLTKINCSLN